MGKVYRNKKEIPIPEGLHINHSDGRVYSLDMMADGRQQKIVLGYATSEKTMHVNDNFKIIYPDLWKLYYGNDDLRPYTLHTGLYALCIGAATKDGLYEAVQQNFGPKHGNAIMDYAMFSMITRLDVTQLFPERMSEEVLFSENVYSDSWFSDLFMNGINREEIHSFKNTWMESCKRRGIGKAWISIDGSNNDCQVEDSGLSDQGKAKSGKHVNIVSYIYAVSSKDGMPITYCVNDGSMVDSKAFHQICMMLEDSGIEIEGVIADRGFCNVDVVKMIRESGYRFVLMLKSNTKGHTDMLQKHAKEIRWNVRCCVGDNGLFGVSEKKHIFGNSKEEAYISLYFDGVNGSERSAALIGRIRKNAREIQKKIDAGKTPSIPKDMKKYLAIDKEKGEIMYDFDSWQESVDEKGYHSLAASDDFGADRTHQIYHLRDASETQFMILKAMEGFNVTRVHCDRSIESKFAVCFIASIIRSEIMNACKGYGYDTNRMLREIDRIQLLLRADGKYYPIRNYTQRQKDILSVFGVSTDSFDAIAYDVTYRDSNPIKSQNRSIPAMPASPKKKRGRPPKKAVETPQPQKKRGRPKGSKNKKTLERMLREQNEPPKEKRGKGRPKGSLNKKTLERLKKEAAQPTKEKRKPGRPKGSLNKSTLERMKREGRL